jgi:hypothetical protein
MTAASAATLVRYSLLLINLRFASYSRDDLTAG